jgi:integrase
VRKKTLFEVKKSGVHNGNKYWYIIGRPNGERIRSWFDSEAEAKAAAKKQNSQLEDYGSKSFTLSASQRAQAEEAIRLLTPYGPSLVDAAQAVISRLELASKSITVQELVSKTEEYYRSIVDRNEATEGHLETLRKAGRRLNAGFGDVRTGELTPGRIEEWLNGLKNKEGDPLATATRNQVHTYVQRIFWYGKKIGVLPSNPLEDTEKARSRKMKEISVLTPDQMVELLKVTSPEIIPFFALGAFAGLRIDEIQKLDWKHVDLEHRKIDLTWFPTKTLQPRWAPISDNLAAWLDPYSRSCGSFIPIARNGKNSAQLLRNLREKAEKKAGLWPWPNNCLRHSYISYRLALTEDVGQVALEAGHDPKTLAAWYRRPIRKEVAEKFWAIFPKWNRTTSI